MSETYRDDGFICDDRNVLEDIRRIRSMSDEEFEKYIEEIKKKEIEKH